MSAKSVEKSRKSEDHFDFSYTQNRELSWLQFDKRVMQEAEDESLPLLERLKMAAIFESNLDEFFMIRVGGLSQLAALKHQPIDNKSNQTPSQQLEAIYEALLPLISEHDASVAAIENALHTQGLTRIGWQDFSATDLKVCKAYYDQEVAPITSPQIVDPRHPFPNLRNMTLYSVFNLASRKEENLLGLIEIPPTLPRVVYLQEGDGAIRYTLLEDVILACATSSFGDYRPVERAVIRLTRNADIDPDEGSFDVEDDYRQHIKKILKKRLRLNPVRLEVNGGFSKNLIKRMRKALNLTDAQVFSVKAPLSMGSFAFGLEDKTAEYGFKDLVYKPFSPQPSSQIQDDVPMHEQILDHDILLYYPYESMDPFLRLLRESANDSDVLQIKITLYRVAKKSRLCESLIAAAENGIEVTVVMELRARFDEENNIEWAERLEDAGCTVLYGSSGFKCHSKICQITRKSKNGDVVRITQLGTGNYNEKTAGLYADYSYMTADSLIGQDASEFFKNMQVGNLNGTYSLLAVAPLGLKPAIMQGLNREIARAQAGEPAYVCFKMNSLTDREVIDKLSEASEAGVEVHLIIRGICCLLPGIPGKTSNITVRNIVGRMLEHARVYMFGHDRDTIYLSSADMMTRNTEHRVEIAFPLLAQQQRDQVIADIELQLLDNVKARELQSDGNYAMPHCSSNDELIDAQARFMERACNQASHAEEVSEPENVEVTPIANDSEEIDQESQRIPSDTSEAVAIMVREKGRASTAWALIKMGLRVLFSGRSS